MTDSKVDQTSEKIIEALCYGVPPDHYPKVRKLITDAMQLQEVRKEFLNNFALQIFIPLVRRIYSALYDENFRGSWSIKKKYGKAIPYVLEELEVTDILMYLEKVTPAIHQVIPVLPNIDFECELAGLIADDYIVGKVKDRYASLDLEENS